MSKKALGGVLRLGLVVHLLLLSTGLSKGYSQATVQGLVTDAQSRRGLASAQVRVVGSDLATLTNSAGRYVLRGVPAGAINLRVELIGYASATRELHVLEGESVVADFGLIPVAIQLDQLVVTGTPLAVRAREIGNTVAQINAAGLTEQVPFSNATDLLRGRVAGLVTIPASGSAGTGGKIRIRGSSSLSLSGEPLVYVDGVRVDNEYSTGPASRAGGIISRMNDFSPADIERIEVIKGPAAATLYGTEASSGVIQIITRRGTVGKPRVSMSISQGANWFHNPAGRIGTVFGRTADGTVEEVNLVDQESARGTPVFRTGRLQEYALSVAGGTETMRYYLSSVLDLEEGALPSSELNRFSSRGNVELELNDRLDLDVNFGYVTGRTYTDQQWQLMWDLLYGGPQFQATRGFLRAPPEAYREAFTEFQDLTRLTAGVQLRFAPLPWFRHRLTIGNDIVHEDNQTIVPRLSAEQNYFGQTGLGYKRVDRRQATYTTVDYSASAELTVSEGIASRTSFGLQFYRKLVELVTAQGSEFPAPGVQTVGSAARVIGDDNFVENSTVGLFVQQQFGWHDRRFVTLAMRADDNSAFGENFELIYYPKISFAWVLSEEPFLELPALNMLRIRSAYGASGQQPDAFAALQTWRPETGPGDSPIVLPQFLGNPDLAPERGEEFEIGFEAGLLNNRLGLDFTYYDQRTRDAILLRSIAPSLGFSEPQFVNVGEIRNKGIEFLIRGRPLATRNADLELTLNLAKNDNKIVSMGGVAPILFNLDFVQRHQEGFPVGAWFERKLLSAELDPQGNPVNVMCDGGPEVNHAPVPCAVAPRLYIGRPDPALEGGFAIDLILLNRIHLHTLLDFKTGHRVWDTDAWLACSVFANCEVNFYPERFDPVYVAGVRAAHHEVYMSPADLLALREISLRYDLPADFALRIGASSASIRLAAMNLHRWTRYSGLDPEVGRSFYGTHQDWLNYSLVPQLAKFVTTVSVRF